ncbi:hypothetical protein FPCIR_12512 [Fusarium pseudocircinatum]|uniref:Uncharacterized protein n=1 Tax=Fusarium pseudocircinatum TaxID=56676 RepID=A0A8H5NRY8_9HYPO|nr:hypothetical protein FPCIR_12512 [Fusarium pseudocircinatum]
MVAFTDDAVRGSPLAAFQVEWIIYLYYTNKSRELRVVTRLERRAWERPQDLQGSRVDGSSQLTDVATRTDNHLFYVAEVRPKPEISHVLHKADYGCSSWQGTTRSCTSVGSSNKRRSVTPEIATAITLAPCIYRWK